jgi:hypothetical protein
MPLMSSKMTFYYKRIYPIIWFGLLAVFILVGLLKGAGSFLLVTVLLAITSYQFMKRMVFMVDEVFDVGDALLVRSGGREERIALADIKNVNYSLQMSPPQVTLSLRRLTVFGDTIVFLPPVRRMKPLSLSELRLMITTNPVVQQKDDRVIHYRAIFSK